MRKITAITMPTLDIMIPAIAIPFPSLWPLILTIPRIRPTIPTGNARYGIQKNAKLTIPRTMDVTAKPMLFLG